MSNDQIVSFDDEPLILVNSQDEIVGHEEKLACHQGQGMLHRAFSIFIFNSQGELLIQQRSEQKPLWPMFWANTCCSHPRRGEETPDAADRRLREELALKSNLEYVYKFEYHASYLDLGSEWELCWVFVGHCDDAADLNPNEVNELRYVAPDVLDQEMEAEPEKFSPWFKMEWKKLRTDHWAQIEKLS